MADTVVVIGAGLAGLSAAYHIGRGAELFEADDTPGGLLRTRWRDGFGFDCTGHLLHLKDAYARELVTGLLRGNLREHVRRAAIYSHGVYTGYPFQANTYGLPPDVARECVRGFMDAPGRRPPNSLGPGNFRDFILHNFGPGIAHHFMLPYNSKLWRVPLDTMGTSGIAPYVPVPTVDEVVRGSTSEGAQGLGYNVTFFYPETGGIYSLVEAMLPGIGDLSLSQRAVEVDPAARSVTFDTGYTAYYDRLVSTIPLPELMRIIRGAPAELALAAGRLRYVSVYDVNIGVARAGLSPYHWVYFPEPEFPFYRAGFLTNFSKGMAPDGCSSMYVEVSHLPGERTPDETVITAVLDGLRKAGILRADDVVRAAEVVDIKYAYVVYDRHMEETLPKVKEYLSRAGIDSIGRYGAWEYSSMEDAILAGRRAAGVAAA